MSAMMIGIEVPTTFMASMETKLARKSPASARFLARPVSSPVSGVCCEGCDIRVLIDVRRAGGAPVAARPRRIASGSPGFCRRGTFVDEDQLYANG
jgi:hypothetical protein